MESTRFKSSLLSISGTTVHLVEIGDCSKQSILLLHGYPENWKEFETVMILLKDKYHMLAIDLPGIGKSGFIEAFDKLSIATFVKEIVLTLKLKDTILVGHDVGGMITYSFIKNFGELINKAVIMCTAIPGVEPWEEVKRNPHIWHFAFYAVPGLPEQLIMGKQRLVFDFFYNSISFNKSAIKEENKQVYAESYTSEEALKTGLGWYRAFPKDEKDNALKIHVEIPVLYLRGQHDYGEMKSYLDGFKKNGLVNIRGESVPGSGHFASEENAEYVANAIDNFISNG